MIERLRARNEWKFFGVLPQADRALAVAWWAVLVLRGLLPALFAIAMGALVGAVAAGRLTWPRRSDWSGSCSCCCRCSRRSTRRSAPTSAAGPPPGSTTGSPTACVRPPGMGHLEDPKLTSDLTMARDFDLGITGPPMSHLDGLHRRRAGGDGGRARLGGRARRRTRGGRRCCWRARGSPRTGCCARARVWRDRNTEEVREAQRHADYAYRLAVEPPAAKELRLFGLADWTVERFRVAPPPPASSCSGRRRACASGRVVWSLLLVLAANVVVFWSMARRGGRRQPGARPAGDLRAAPPSAPA